MAYGGTYHTQMARDDCIGVIKRILALADYIKAAADEPKLFKAHCKTLTKRVQDVFILLDKMKSCLQLCPPESLLHFEKLGDAVDGCHDLLLKCKTSSKLFLIDHASEIIERFNKETSFLQQGVEELPLKLLTMPDSIFQMVQTMIKSLKRTSYTMDRLESRPQGLLNALQDKQQLNMDKARVETLLKCLGLNSDEARQAELKALEIEQNQNDITFLYALVRTGGSGDRKLSSDSFGSGDEMLDGTQFECPLSEKIMTDPVIIASGVTYEREYITYWLRNKAKKAIQKACPVTKKKLSIFRVSPNFEMRAEIRVWCRKHGQPVPSRLEGDAAAKQHADAVKRITWLIENGVETKGLSALSQKPQMRSQSRRGRMWNDPGGLDLQPPSRGSSENGRGHRWGSFEDEDTTPAQNPTDSPQGDHGSHFERHPGFGKELHPSLSTERRNSPSRHGDPRYGSGRHRTADSHMVSNGEGSRFGSRVAGGSGELLGRQGGVGAERGTEHTHLREHGEMGAGNGSRELPVADLGRDLPKRFAHSRHVSSIPRNGNEDHDKYDVGRDDADAEGDDENRGVSYADSHPPPHDASRGIPGHIHGRLVGTVGHQHGKRTQSLDLRLPLDFGSHAFEAKPDQSDGQHDVRKARRALPHGDTEPEFESQPVHVSIPSTTCQRDLSSCRDHSGVGMGSRSPDQGLPSSPPLSVRDVRNGQATPLSPPWSGTMWSGSSSSSSDRATVNPEDDGMPVPSSPPLRRPEYGHKPMAVAELPARRTPLYIPRRLSGVGMNPPVNDSHDWQRDGSQGGHKPREARESSNSIAPYYPNSMAPQLGSESRRNGHVVGGADINAVLSAVGGETVGDALSCHRETIDTGFANGMDTARHIRQTGSRTEGTAPTELGPSSDAVGADRLLSDIMASEQIYEEACVTKKDAESKMSSLKKSLSETGANAVLDGWAWPLDDIKDDGKKSFSSSGSMSPPKQTSRGEVTSSQPAFDVVHVGEREHQGKREESVPEVVAPARPLIRSHRTLSRSTSFHTGSFSSCSDVAVASESSISSQDGARRGLSREEVRLLIMEASSSRAELAKQIELMKTLRKMSKDLPQSRMTIEDAGGIAFAGLVLDKVQERGREGAEEDWEQLVENTVAMILNVSIERKIKMTITKSSIAKRLVDLLDEALTEDIREMAAEAMVSLLSDRALHSLICELGAIRALAALLLNERASVSAKGTALKALKTLSSNIESRMEMLNYSVIDFALRTAQQPGNPLTESALVIVNNLMCDGRGRARVADANGVYILCKLLQRKDSKVLVEYAVAILSAVALSENVLSEIANFEGIMDLLNGIIGNHPESTERSVRKAVALRTQLNRRAHGA